MLYKYLEFYFAPLYIVYFMLELFLPYCLESKHELNVDSPPTKLPIRMRLGLPAPGSPPEDRVMPRRRNRKVKLKRNVMLGPRSDDKVKCCTTVSTSEFLHILFLRAQHTASRSHPLLTFCVGKEHATFCVTVQINFTIMAFSVICFWRLLNIAFNKKWKNFWKAGIAMYMFIAAYSTLTKPYLSYILFGIL
jgi:hypothetical protein